MVSAVQVREEAPLRGRAEVAYQAHNLKVAGSNPAPGTILFFF